MKNTIKRIASVAVIGSMLFSFVGCAKIKAYDKKEVKDILKNELDLKDDKDYYTYDWDDYKSFSGSNGKANFYIRIYEDADDAQDVFEDYLDDIEDDKDDKVLDGKIKISSGKTSGYITFSGEANDDGDFFIEDEYYYGGIYWADNMIIVVCAEKDKDTAREDVTAFLRAFKLPRP